MTSTSYQPLNVSLEPVISNHLAASARAMEKVSSDPRLLAQLTAISNQVLDCLSSGGKLLICGNGGSAADAQHIAAEFVGRYKIASRHPLPAIALTTDSSALTAIANDFGYDVVFSRQVMALGKPNDLLWAISTSGASENVRRAVVEANRRGMRTVAFTSFKAPDTLTGLLDASFKPFETSTAILQQLHITAAHAICDAVERQLAP